MNLDPKQILEYVKESSALVSEMNEKIASLQTDKTRLATEVKEGKVALAQKEASEKEAVFTEKQVRPVLEKLAKARRIKNVDASVKLMVNNPVEALKELDKLAANLLSSVPSIGKSVRSSVAPGASDRESDRQFENHFNSLGQRL